MRRSFALVCLFGIGCGYGTAPDTDAAQALVLRLHSNVDTIVDVDQQPEYATIAKIPGREAGNAHQDKSAACGVRVRFQWRDGGRTTHDDWVVWVTSDHKAVGWSSNTKGDNWREYVRSFAVE
jgi:hypothetical protein